MLRLNLKHALCLLAITLISSSSYAADKKEAGKEEAKKPELCINKKVSSRGRPNRIRAMASMNAVIQWINHTKKQHGSKYAQWHTALEPNISCEKIKDSDYHICFAAGKPCQVQPPEDSKKLPRKEDSAIN